MFISLKGTTPVRIYRNKKKCNAFVNQTLPEVEINRINEDSSPLPKNEDQRKVNNEYFNISGYQDQRSNDIERGIHNDKKIKNKNAQTLSQNYMGGFSSRTDNQYKSRGS